MRTRIKFCGIKKQSDFVYAVSLGADIVGLVFYEASPRYIDIAHAQSLINEADRSVKVASLFMDADHDFIADTLRQINVDYIQFHGTESVEFCTSFSLPYIKAIPMADEAQANEMIEAHRNSADILLLDGHRVGMPGGGGIAFDWRDFSKLNASIFVAGGLNPENVAQAIAQCRPQGVDVSSGVESTAGVKDPALMKAFAQAVLRADSDATCYGKAY